MSPNTLFELKSPGLMQANEMHHCVTFFFSVISVVYHEL